MQQEPPPSHCITQVARYRNDLRLTASLLPVNLHRAWTCKFPHVCLGCCRFVTYKWPSWLHKQTEKQRIIWAYKILFLDVLFPLGLRKVGGSGGVGRVGGWRRLEVEWPGARFGCSAGNVAWCLAGASPRAKHRPHVMWQLGIACALISTPLTGNQKHGQLGISQRLLRRVTVDSVRKPCQ